MMPLQPGERLVAIASDLNGRRSFCIYGGQGATVRSMIARIDAAHANSRSAQVIGEYTSDGTRWGLGLGRVLASREPRNLDGRFYSGWIVE